MTRSKYCGFECICIPVMWDVILQSIYGGTEGSFESILDKYNKLIVDIDKVKLAQNR